MSGGGHVHGGGCGHHGDGGRNAAQSDTQIASAVLAWQASSEQGNAPPLRFSIGMPVECFAGGGNWVRGTVVAHNYREPSWEKAHPTAPYQVLLDPEFTSDGKGQNAMWAPADVDEIIRASFRFELEAAVDARVTEDEWVRATVVGRLYSEPGWEERRCAPYQLRVDGVLPGCRDEQVLGLAAVSYTHLTLPTICSV
eukprot:3881605-Prymnesium_polylepis.1